MIASVSCTHDAVSVSCTHDAAAAVVHTILSVLQASTYEIPNEELDLESHEMIDTLYDASTDDKEFDEMVEVVRHMLHPNACARASVSHALQSPVFVDH